MNTKIKRNLIDFSFEALDSPERRLDFAFITKLKSQITIEELYTGAELAFKCFPKSNGYIKNYDYIPCREKWEIEQASCESKDTKKVIGDFLQKPLQLHKERGVKQLYLLSNKELYLVTQMHHSLGDAMSFFSWLYVQVTRKTFPNKPLKIKKHKQPIRKSIYSHNKPCLIFGQKNKPTSNQRDWASFSLDKPSKSQLKKFYENSFSYNDLLCAIVFKALREYNQIHNLSNERNGIYLPMNIRSNFYEGFGNGSSRIKIYDKFSPQCSYKDTAQNIREQIKWCQQNGMWHIPEILPITSHLPKIFHKALVKAYARLKHQDFCSFIFSHLERLGNLTELLNNFSETTIISQLYKTYPMALSALTFENKTVFSSTWDKSRLSQNEIDLFFSLIREKKKVAFKELQI